MANYISLPSISSNKVLTASYLNQLNDDLRILSLHNHSGSLGEGASDFNVGNSASPFVRRHEIIPFISPSQSNVTLTTTLSACQYFFNAFLAMASPASALYPLGLVAGTYRVSILHETNTNLGIASVLIGTSSLGQFDSYSSPSNIARANFNASIPSSGSYVLTIRASGNKGASATNSEINYMAIHALWTGSY